MNKIIDKMIDFSPLFYQLFRFGMVGLCASFIHFSVVVLLVQTKLMVPLTANVIGFMSGFQLSYWGHRYWTFGVSDILHRVAIPKLLAVQVFIFSANESLFYIFLSYHLPYPLALLLVLSILPVFSFSLSKLWVFR